MIEYNGNQYQLKFNIERIKLVEKALKKPLITIYSSQGGAFSLEEMETIFLICLKPQGSDFFCNNKEAREIFNDVIQQENGYVNVNNEIATVLMEDCPFLFPKIS